MSALETCTYIYKYAMVDSQLLEAQRFKGGRPANEKGIVCYSDCGVSIFTRATPRTAP